MNIETVTTTFLVLVLSFVLFIIFGISNFKEFHKKNYYFLGNFPFEMHSCQEMKINNYVRSTLLIFILSSIFFQISLFSLVNIISHTLLIILGSLSAISLGMMFFVNLNNIKLHVLSVTLSLSLSILSYLGLLYLGLKTPLFIENKIVLYILAGLFAIFEFSLIFHPNMKTWMNYEEVINEDGSVTHKRGKRNFLASLEWIIIANHLIYLIISLVFIIPNFLI